MRDDVPSTAPDDWPPRLLGNIGCVYGGISGKNKADFDHGTARYVTFLNVLENVRVEPDMHETVSVLSGESQNTVQVGDLLFNGTSETAKDLALGSVVEEATPNLYLNSFCFGFRLTHPREHDALFLAYYFRGPVGRRHLSALAQGATRYNLSKRQFLHLEIALPGYREQRTIAEALSDVDGLLGELEALLAKKRAIKQAAMQQLLTGKTRLPGFSGKWERKRLEELFQFKNGLNKAKRFFGQGTAIVNYMDVFENPTLRGSTLVGRVQLSRQEIDNFDVRQGDVFFTRTSETVEEVGTAAVMLDDPTDTVFSGFVLRARPLDQSISDLYKAYCFAAQGVRRQIVSTASYTTRALTNGTLLSLVSLTLPPTSEQVAIATVLSDMDAEIAALEARRDKTRAIKQGMMQQLLTGRVRLVEPGGASAP